MLGKIEGRRRRGQQRMRWLDGISKSKDMSLNKLRGIVKEGKPGTLHSMRSQRVGRDCVTEQQQGMHPMKNVRLCAPEDIDKNVHSRTTLRPHMETTQMFNSKFAF